MFRFLIGVAFGAAAYWAWQSFGRDLLGMSSDQDTTYGGFNNSSSSSFSGGTPASTTSYGTSSSAPTGSSGGSTPTSPGPTESPATGT